MLAKRIIPCLDVADGRVVKGTNFINLRDAGDPVELALHYNQQGADELVFLDITASSDKRTTLLDLVKKTASTLFIPFTVGGGINDISIINDVLGAGADKVSINTAAVNSPELITTSSQRFGSQCIVAAIDAKKIQSPSNITYPISEVQLDKNSTWEVFTHGGRHPTGIDAVKWASFLDKKGAGELLLTSVDIDGTKAGYDISLTQAVSQAVKIPVIASGGAGTTQHIIEALNVCDAALLASLLHFKELTIDDIKTSSRKEGLQIR